jgi:hypothetical protein
VACGPVVFEPIFPIVDRCAAIWDWLEAVRGKIGVGTRVSDDLLKSNGFGKMLNG